MPPRDQKGPRSPLRVKALADYLRAEPTRLLGLTLCLNLGFALFKLSAGLYYRSLWFCTLGLYYALLGLMRFLLLTSLNSGASGRLPRPLQGWRTYRLCGLLMLLLNLLVSIVVLRVVHENDGYRYPGSLIYLSAAYVFFCLISSTLSVWRTRSFSSPEQGAAKRLSLAQASVSLLALQTAMISRFGDAPAFRRQMNSLTGTAVCVFTLSLACAMIARAQRELKAGARR